MDDALLVRRLQRFGDLLRDRQRLVERDRLRARSAARGLTLDQLHHERADAAALFEAVDVRDVRMVQRGEDLGFALEAREALGVGGERRRAGP